MIPGIVAAQAALSSGGGGQPAPNLGEPYAGGYYAGSVNYGGSSYYLVIAAKSAEQSGKLWKTTNTNTPGTSSLDDGRANTLSMLGPEHEVGQLCMAYRGGDFADWYLPARNELLAICQNLNPGGVSTPTEFKTGGSQAMSPSSGGYYWSSTQSVDNIGAAVTVTPINQAVINWDKNFPLVTMRPVRRVKF